MIKALQRLWWGYSHYGDKYLPILVFVGNEIGSPPNLGKEHLSHGHQRTLPTCQQGTNFSFSQGPCGKSSTWAVERAILAAASSNCPSCNTLLHRL